MEENQTQEENEIPKEIKNSTTDIFSCNRNNMNITSNSDVRNSNFVNQNKKYNSICINEDTEKPLNQEYYNNDIINKTKLNYKGRLSKLSKDGNYLTTKAEKIISKLLHLRNKALSNNDKEDAVNLNW